MSLSVSLSVILLAVLSGWAGCSSESARSCDTDDDCFEGERCVSEVCKPSEGNGSGTAGGGTTGGGSSSGGSTGGSTTAGDTGAGKDTGGTGGTGTGGVSDAGDAGSEETGYAVCEGHVGTCQDDGHDNNGQQSSKGKRLFPEADLYCESDENRRLEAKQTISGRLCPKEEGGIDWYRVKMSPCDGPVATVRAELEMQPVCPEERFTFDLRCSGPSKTVIAESCNESSIRRGTDGDVRWIEVYPDSVLAPWFLDFKVSAPGAEVGEAVGPDFAYDLTVSVEQPL